METSSKGNEFTKITCTKEKKVALFILFAILTCGITLIARMAFRNARKDEAELAGKE